MGSVTRKKVRQPLAPSDTAASSRGTLLFHQRDQFAGDEGESDEDRRDNDAGDGKEDLDAAGVQPRAENAVGAEKQNEDETRDDRRDCKRQVDQGEQERFELEVELGDGPAQPQCQRRGSWNGDSGDEQRQAKRRHRVRHGERLEVDANAAAEGLDEDHEQGAISISARKLALALIRTTRVFGPPRSRCGARGTWRAGKAYS